MDRPLDRDGPTVVPEWYAQGIGAPVISHDDALRAMPRVVRFLAGRSAVARGVGLAIAARRGRLAVIKGLPGTSTALVASALMRAGRRVVVLEFIRRPPSAVRLRRVLYELWRRLVEAPAMRRALLAGHTLTGWERLGYARVYGIEEGRFVEIPWPLCRWGGEPQRDVAEVGSKVMSSGRAHTDWETLFAAARGSEWDLTVSCSTLDAPSVRAMNDVGADVHVELTRAEHDHLLRESDVYVMAMREAGASAGHVRLMAAVEAGTPVVASDIRALEGYAESGGTAVLVTPGDSAGLRAAVDALLTDPDERRRLRDAALARARGWTYEDYFDRIRALVLNRG